MKKVQNLQISGFRKTPENGPPKKGLFLGLPNWQEFHFLGVFLKIKPIFRDKKSTKRMVLTPQKGGPPPWGGPPTPPPGGRGVGVPHPSPPGGPPPGGVPPPPPGGGGRGLGQPSQPGEEKKLTSSFFKLGTAVFFFMLIVFILLRFHRLPTCQLAQLFLFFKTVLFFA